MTLVEIKGYNQFSPTSTKKYNIFKATAGGVLKNPRSFAYQDLNSNNFRPFKYR